MNLLRKHFLQVGYKLHTWRGKEICQKKEDLTLNDSGQADSKGL